MKRQHRLFLKLWVVVVVLLTYKLYPIVDEHIPREQVVDYHVMQVTAGMLEFVQNKDQLAVIIGHEFGHVILGHTMSDGHKAEDEYHADMVGMLLAHKAGYSLCGMDKFWRAMGENYMSLHTGSHPNVFIRSYYSEMPECIGKTVEVEKVTEADAYEVFNNMAKMVEGRLRYNTMFGIYPSFNYNAFVYTVTKDKK